MPELREDDRAFIAMLGPVSFDWMEPITVTMLHGEDGALTGLACRLCIGRYGLKSTDYHRLMRREEFPIHMATEHLE